MTKPGVPTLTVIMYLTSTWDVIVTDMEMDFGISILIALAA